jgi:hypothetical protein
MSCQVKIMDKEEGKTDVFWEEGSWGVGIKELK